MATTRHEGPAASGRRGFVLVLVAAVVALAAAIAVSQSSMAASVARSGTQIDAAARARVIADACLESALRYAKHGVDNGSWDDFDDLLDPSGGSTPGDDDFIPTTCPAGDRTYIPKATALDTGYKKGLHRYCAVRMEGGVCFIRFDDNSDDGKDAAVISSNTTGGVNEGSANNYVDQPARDQDFSVYVTAIGAFPARGDTPVLDLHASAQSVVTRRALLQVEIQAQSAWPSIHAPNVTFRAGPGVGNYSVRSCGAGGIAAGTLSSGEANDGCVCGNHRIGAGATNIDGEDGSCSCGTTLCASGSETTAYPPVDTNGVIDAVIEAAPGDWDPDYLPPALPTLAWAGVAPGNAFMSGNTDEQQSITAQLSSATTVSPGANGRCEIFFGGKTNNFGQVTTSTAVANTRAVFVWDHTDTNTIETLTSADGWGVATVGTAPVTTNCNTFSSTTLPAPCDWHLTMTGDDLKTPGAAQVDFDSCAVPASLCWRPVALLDGKGNKEFTATTSEYKESTKDNSGVEAFQPTDGLYVPLVRGTPAALPVGGPPPPIKYLNFCGDTSHADTNTGPTDYGPAWKPGVPNWTIPQDITGTRWPSAGTYWIFDSDRLWASNQLGTGDGASRLMVTIISKGAVILDDRIHVGCPGCATTAASPTDETLSGLKSPGFFIYSAHPCRLYRPARINGDILCEVVALPHGGGGGDHPIAIYSDVFAPGLCGGWSCPSVGSLGTYPGSGPSIQSVCDTAWSATLGTDDPGICLEKHLGHSSAWVGRLWAQRDIILDDDNWVAVPPVPPPAGSPPLYPTGGPHPEWPALWSLDDIHVNVDNVVEGKIMNRGGGIDIISSNNIRGRVVSEVRVNFGGTISSSGKNRVTYDGAGVVTVAIDDQVSYLDTGW